LRGRRGVLDAGAHRQVHGEHSEGFRALAIALEHGLPVLDLRRYWAIIDGEPTGTYWELTFRQRRLQ